MGYKPEKVPVFSGLDIGIALGAIICLVTARYVSFIQYIPATFAVLLCMQDKVKLTWKTGLYRIIITIVAGIIGIGVILADMAAGNEWLFFIFAFIGLVITMVICKLLSLPPMLARIGALTLVLVVTVLAGNERIMYAVLRLVGTFYGVLVSIVLSFIMSLSKAGKTSELKESAA